MSFADFKCYHKPSHTCVWCNTEDDGNYPVACERCGGSIRKRGCPDNNGGDHIVPLGKATGKGLSRERAAVVARTEAERQATLRAKANDIMLSNRQEEPQLQRMEGYKIAPMNRISPDEMLRQLTERG